MADPKSPRPVQNSQPEAALASEIIPDANEAASAILRRGHELPKPKNWQDFQARCVILFQEVLGDPHCMEYGRPGQRQGGIDILGRRGERFVGIQVRRIVKPLDIKKIRADVNAALALPFDFCEIIFATTAPDSIEATQAAHAVEQEIRAQGKHTVVVVYGWEALHQLISRYPTAYAYFNPNLHGPVREQPIDPGLGSRIEQKLDLIYEVTSRHALLSSPDPKRPNEQEDAALHARIDTFRDLMRDGQSKLALDGFTQLLPKIDRSKAPFAFFRVKTNMASSLLNLAREQEAAELWSEAYQLRPNDPRAITGLAMAKLVLGLPTEAMALAQDALKKDNSCADAVSALLQAAARTDWHGDPEELIPEALRGTEQADAGLLEFKRLRGDESWVDDARALCSKHELPYFAQIAALAVLERVIKSGILIPEAVAALQPGEVDAAAATLKSTFEQKERQGSASGDLLASGNNAAIALRLAGRYAEAIAVLHGTIRHVGREPPLVRMLGILQLSEGNNDEGAATLATILDDPEAQLIRAELQATVDPRAALSALHGINSAGLPQAQKEHRAILWAELSLILNDLEEYRLGTDELRGTSQSRGMTGLFDIEGEVQFKRLALETAVTRLGQLASTLDAGEPLLTRIAIAKKLSLWGDQETASNVLEGHTDLSRPTEATKLYLQSLGAARRDDAFNQALQSSSQQTRDDPDVLWMSAAHAWNSGDVAAASAAIDRLLQTDDKNLSAFLLKADILIRLDLVIELRALLERPLESYRSRRLADRLRLVQMLVHFGFFQRACALAYRLLLENRDQSRAWISLASVVLSDPNASETRAAFDMPNVQLNAAVDVEFNSGQTRFVVIEPDATLRALDSDSVEPDHELAVALKGLSAGASFQLPDGRQGVIKQVRHKYIARFHDVIARYEERFPTQFGFKTFRVDPSASAGVDEMIRVLKERHDFVTEETLEYVNGLMPLGVLAQRVGVDIIDAAAGVAEIGQKLKVCAGNELERRRAIAAVRRNAGKGCILDPLSFWTAYRLNALELIVETCGPIHLSQRTLDVLRERRTKLRSAGVEDQKTIGYQDGKIVLSEVSAERLQFVADDIQQAIEWAEKHASIDPVRASELVPESVRDVLRSESDLLDECILALNSALLLITDDGPVRQIAEALDVRNTTWVQAVLLVAAQNTSLSATAYVEKLALLLTAGQSYLGVSSGALVTALGTDAKAGVTTPGQVFHQLASTLGGKSAEPNSHISVAVEAIGILWGDGRFRRLREAATGLLLEGLIRERSDYLEILAKVSARIRAGGPLAWYVSRWLVGHFIPLPFWR